MSNSGSAYASTSRLPQGSSGYATEGNRAMGGVKREREDEDQLDKRQSVGGMLPSHAALARKLKTTFQMPSVGDTFPSRHALQVATSYAWHQLGHPSTVGRTPQPGNDYTLHFGCPRNHVALRNPVHCPVRLVAKPVEDRNVVGGWKVVQMVMEHNHERPPSLKAWKEPKEPRGRTWGADDFGRRKRQRRARSESETRSEGSSEGSGEEESEEESEEEVIVSRRASKKRRIDPPAASTKPRQSLPAKLPSHSKSYLPSPPRRLSSFTPAPVPPTSSRNSATSRLLTPSEVSNILASFYPSLRSLGPILHESGVRSTNGFMALISMEEERLAEELEKLEVRKLQRTMLVGKLAELRRELEL